MKENSRNLSRDLLRVGAVCSVGLLGYGLYQVYQFGVQEGVFPHPIETAPIPTDLLEKLQEIEVSTPTPTPFLPLFAEEPLNMEVVEVATPEATLEAGDLFGEKIDLFGSIKKDETIEIPPKIRGVFSLKDSGKKFSIGEFIPQECVGGIDCTPEKGLGKTWRNYHQYEGKNLRNYFLFLHSGRDKFTFQPFEMTDLQEFLDFVQEGEQKGWCRNFTEPNEILKNNIIGSSLLLDQGKNGSVLGKIEAAVRIPPLEVDRLHEAYHNDPSKILEYIAQNYPGYGFENILDKNRSLTLMTCGKSLNGGEIPDPDRKPYEQALYFFVITTN